MTRNRVRHRNVDILWKAELLLLIQMQTGIRETGMGFPCQILRLGHSSFHECKDAAQDRRAEKGVSVSMALKRPLPFSLGLGLLTWVLIAVLKHFLSASQALGRIFDTLAYPGALLANLVYPQGLHTGRGSPGWALVVTISNLLLYILIWYLCLKILERLSRNPRG